MKNSLLSHNVFSKKTVKLSLIGVFFTLVILLLVSCGKDIIPTPTPTIPVLSTTDVANITTTSATVGGSISFNGDALISERGVCFGLISNPTVTDNKVTSGVGDGNFTVTLSGLTAGTSYHARAYAINSKGIAYGSNISFTTIPLMYNVTIITGANGSASISGTKQFAAQSVLKIDLTPTIGYMVSAVKINNVSYPLTVNSFNYTVDKDNATLEFGFKFDYLWWLLDKNWTEVLYRERDRAKGYWVDYGPGEFSVEKFVFHNNGMMTPYRNGNQGADLKYLQRNDSVFVGIYPLADYLYGDSYKITKATKDTLILQQTLVYKSPLGVLDPTKDRDIQKIFKN